MKSARSGIISLFCKHRYQVLAAPFLLLGFVRRPVRTVRYGTDITSKLSPALVYLFHSRATIFRNVRSGAVLFPVPGKYYSTPNRSPVFGPHIQEQNVGSNEPLLLSWEKEQVSNDYNHLL